MTGDCGFLARRPETGLGMTCHPEEPARPCDEGSAVKEHQER
jgi:hypothetical protein